jgi:hypothetical protein
MSDLAISIESNAAAWAAAFRQAPEAMRNELRRTTNALVAEGIGLAQENAPVDIGQLKASIVVVQAATISGDGVTGSYGSRGVIYARIQELGGTITPKRGQWLVFQTKNGQWVKVRSVTITGTHYIEKSRASLRPRAREAYAMAVNRALASIGPGA